MRPATDYDLPPDKEQVNKRAVQLQWLTIAYILSAIAVLALVLGQSQAMKAAWVEDVLSLLPPIAFLVASRVRDKPPTKRFPYGYHRSVTIGYSSPQPLCSRWGSSSSVTRRCGWSRPRTRRSASSSSSGTRYGSAG